MPDTNTIHLLSKTVEQLQKRAGRKGLSLDDAFLIAAELESSEINGIYARLVGPVRGTPYILRKKIETLGLDHMNSLIRGARKFRVSEKAIARLIALKHPQSRKAG